MRPTWDDVRAAIEHGEGESTEFKTWAAFPDKVAIAMCAFANANGGIVILGVADDRTIVGVPGNPDDVQERITSLLQSGLSSPIGAHVGWHDDGGKVVHWIAVRRIRGPEPFRCKGKVYVRRGRASGEPSSAELQDLYNIFGYVVTEEQVVIGSSDRDVDENAVRRFLARQGLDLDEEPQPLFVADLCNRMISREVDGEVVLTVYGALAFAAEPQRFAPLQNAWVELVAYAGEDRADDVILRGEAKGRLDEQVERAVGWLKSLGIHESYEGIYRKDSLLVPERAFREVMVNAITHRDYGIVGSRGLVEVFSDRVDVTSPGPLPNHMTPAAVLAGGIPRSRNQFIANFMVVARLMEQRGRGLPIVRREMKQWNGTVPDLVSSEEGGFVRVTLWRKPRSPRLQR